MGMAPKWFRSLFSSKNHPPNHNNNNKYPLSDSSHTSLNFKNYAENPPFTPYVEANNHAIAVAAATAAVAEAALAAAQAAAQVVRLTSGRNAPHVPDRRSVLAAIRIQSAFRAYLARRALRALRGLVKLQALVRGRIVRKQSADMLYRMQTMARIQARASAQRSYSSNSSHARYNFSNSNRTNMPNLGKRDESLNTVKYDASLLKQHHMTSRWLNHWMEHYAWNDLNETSIENRHGGDERNDKILEVDTWKPHQQTSRNHQAVPTSHSFSDWNNELEQDRSRIVFSRVSSKLQKPYPSISSEEARTAENSPRLYSALSRPSSNLRGPFTPARSECSSSVHGDYFGHPSYMANTKSSRAKVRSHSAPKQRTLQYEELGLSSKQGHDPWDMDTKSEKGCLAANRGSNTYIYPGLLKRQGTPKKNAPVGLRRV